MITDIMDGNTKICEIQKVKTYGNRTGYILVQFYLPFFLLMSWLKKKILSCTGEKNNKIHDFSGH